MRDEMLTSNSPSAIQQRIQAGHIGWAGPLVLTTARTVLILLVQVVVATDSSSMAIFRLGVLKRLGGQSTLHLSILAVSCCFRDRRGAKGSD